MNTDGLLECKTTRKKITTQELIESHGNPSPFPPGIIPPRREFPYLIVRIMCGMWQREDIAIAAGEPEVYIGYFRSRVHCLNPLDDDGELTPACRQLLLDGTIEAATRLGFLMCLVWDAEHCTYCKREGGSYDADQPPAYTDHDDKSVRRLPGYGNFVFDQMKTPWNNK